MKNCSNCNTQNKDTANFCKNCGKAFDEKNLLRKAAAPSPQLNYKDKYNKPIARMTLEQIEKELAELGDEETGKGDLGRVESEFKELRTKFFRDEDTGERIPEFETVLKTLRERKRELLDAKTQKIKATTSPTKDASKTAPIVAGAVAGAAASKAAQAGAAATASVAASTNLKTTAPPPVSKPLTPESTKAEAAAKFAETFKTVKPSVPSEIPEDSEAELEKLNQLKNEKNSKLNEIIRDRERKESIKENRQINYDKTEALFNVGLTSKENVERSKAELDEFDNEIENFKKEEEQLASELEDLNQQGAEILARISPEKEEQASGTSAGKIAAAGVAGAVAGGIVGAGLGAAAGEAASKVTQAGAGVTSAGALASNLLRKTSAPSPASAQIKTSAPTAPESKTPFQGMAESGLKEIESRIGKKLDAKNLKQKAKDEFAKNIILYVIPWVLLGATIALCIWAFFGGGILHSADLWVPIVLLIIAIAGIVISIILSIVLPIGKIGLVVAWIFGIVCLVLTIAAWVMSLSITPEQIMDAGIAASSGDFQPLLNLFFELTGINLAEFSGIIDEIFSLLEEYGLSFGSITDLFGMLTGNDTANIGLVDIPPLT